MIMNTRIREDDIEESQSQGMLYEDVMGDLHEVLRELADSNFMTNRRFGELEQLFLARYAANTAENRQAEPERVQGSEGELEALAMSTSPPGEVHNVVPLVRPDDPNRQIDSESLREQREAEARAEQALRAAARTSEPAHAQEAPQEANEPQPQP